MRTKQVPATGIKEIQNPVVPPPTGGPGNLRNREFAARAHRAAVRRIHFAKKRSEARCPGQSRPRSDGSTPWDGHCRPPSLGPGSKRQTPSARFGCSTAMDRAQWTSP